MDHNTLLGSTFSCTCGKEHTVPTREFHYGNEAYDLLPTIARTITEYESYLVIADTRTMKAAGMQVISAFTKSGISPDCYIVPDSADGSPETDDITKDRILNEAPSTELYLAVGSGVINDLVKWVAYLNKKPYIAIPTAASMNGYGSANVAATVDGLKVLFHAEACKAVVVNPHIIANAPYELTASGLGDVLAKPVSSADWKLNHFLFNEYYCQYSVDLLKNLEPVYLENPSRIQQKDPDAIHALFQALFYSSIAMTITGTSAPASGGEHLISHTLDMLAGRDGRTHDLHGKQVGVASILMAALYEKILYIDSPQFNIAPAEIDSEYWGSLSSVVAEEFSKKQSKFEQAASLLSQPDNWDKLKEQISSGLVPAHKLKNCLKNAGAAHRFHDITDNGLPLSRQKFTSAVIHAHQMRQRFTVLDIAVLLGLASPDFEELIEQWLT